MTHLTTAIDPIDVESIEVIRITLKDKCGVKPTMSGILRLMIYYIIYNHLGEFIKYAVEQYRLYGKF